MHQSSYIRVPHTICRTCDKLAYSTELLAKNALRDCQARGRDEKSIYQCRQNPNVWHLSRYPEEKSFTPVGRSIEYGHNHEIITIVRKADGRISVVISYPVRSGKRVTSVANLTHEEALQLHDLLTLSIFDNSDGP